MDIEQALSQAELYIRQNQTSQARMALGEILRENPQNEEAWILSAQVSDKPEQVMYCLRQAIKINPASSRARLLLERLQLPQTPTASLPPSQPAQQTLTDTQPSHALPQAAAIPEETTPVYSGTQSSEPTGTAAEPEISSPARSDYMYTDLGGNETENMGMVEGVAIDSDSQTEVKKRPMRWLQRGFTILGTACLLAPWIVIQGDGSSSRTVTGVQVLLGPIFSPLGTDVGIASLALLASLVLLLLMFFRFKTTAAQKWGERATLALAPLASVLCLDMISFFYAGLTNNVELRWGIWATGAFYSLAGLTALINARRLGTVSRAELYAARAGWIFTWLFCFGDILAILVTVIGLAMFGKFSLVATAIPFIWLILGALLSLIA
jgi:uncharacterized membrane protein